MISSALAQRRQQRPGGAHQYHGGVAGPEQHRAQYQRLAFELGNTDLSSTASSALAQRRQHRPGGAHQYHGGVEDSEQHANQHQPRVTEGLALRRHPRSPVHPCSAGTNDQAALTNITVASLGRNSTAVSTTSA